ncbi:SGNH hydrolase [Mytilinidion resinicola]|uniref:SGNH hydrolase n=1 Tax=Mytilinidion resinicola TaxID=574789 RepID=A0A6A6Y111_9PEZI|nr:SGNH hydrolase [Mytilinidion resinicola]KAF2802496.1 SGNH hydrolase [Mytilinidion resinicola]
MIWGASSLLVCFIPLLSVSAIPVNTEADNALAITRSAQAAKAPALRIHAIGASIVYGQGSAYGNGFRRAMRSALVAEGRQVNMIGSKKCGQMGDNECDGFPGLRISQVQNQTGLKTALKQKPNVVLVLAGTNDALQGHDPNAMANDMYNFISYILSIATNAVVVVSTLPPNGNKKAEAVIKGYNTLLADVVEILRGDLKKPVFMVDNHSSWWSMADMQSDGTHPNDNGYVKMARVFYDGIHTVAPWTTTPAQSSLPAMGPSDPKSIGPAPVLPQQPKA